MIRVDPASTTGRAATPAVTVRAVAVRDGRTITDVASATYIFIRSGQNPEVSRGRMAHRELDYDMDPDVVNDPRFSGSIEASLKDIPTFCINTDLRTSSIRAPAFTPIPRGGAVTGSGRRPSS